MVYPTNKFYPKILAGFRAVPPINPEKTTPIPTPAPIKPQVAKPEEIYFADANINK
jgi:hypothetical protein